MPRTAVTSSSVRAYLDGAVTEGNYALFHGLHRLPQGHFSAVMDLLLNGEAFPEELIRLGSFSAEEAEDFIRRMGTRWDGRFLADPSVTGTGGNAYFLDTLGLRDLVKAAKAAEGWDFSPVKPYTGVSFTTGLGAMHVSAVTLAEALLPSMQAGLAASGAASLAQLFPADFSSLPLPSTSTTKRAQLRDWAGGALSVLLSPGGVTPADVLAKLFTVDGVPSELSTCPSVAQFLLGDTRPHRSAQLQVLREAAANRSGVPLTEQQASARLAAVLATRPTEWAVSGTVAQMDTALRVCGYFYGAAGIAAPSSFVLGRDALQGLFDYRDRLRRFIWATVLDASKRVVGSYPSTDGGLVRAPFKVRGFATDSLMRIVLASNGEPAEL